MNPPIRRGLFGLHRDTLRTLAGAPLALMLVPMAIWFPIDCLAEYISLQETSFAGEFRAYNRVNQAFGFVANAWLAGLALAVVARRARGEASDLSAELRASFALFPSLIRTAWSAAWRIGLGFLAFLIPGFVLTIRYSLALPVTAAQGLQGPEALKESARLVHGQALRLFGYSLWAYVAWFGVVMLPPIALAFGWEFAFETEVPLVVDVIAWLPLNIVPVGLVVGSALVYRDTRNALGESEEDSSPSETLNPIGTSDTSAPRLPEFQPTGVLGVALVSVFGIGGGGLLAVVLVMLMMAE
jgi:hypothetical protein